MVGMTTPPVRKSPKAMAPESQSESRPGSGDAPQFDQRRRHDLGALSWPEIDHNRGGVLLVPVGSCEQHGPHLPLDTDRRVAQAVADRVAEMVDDVFVAPPVNYGSSGEHQAFAGTLSIGTAALTTLLVELGRSAFPPDGSSPFSALCFVNGHGGNLLAVRRAVAVLEGEGRPVSSWSPAVPDGDAHAGRTETSLMLHLADELVGDERPVGATGSLAELEPVLRSAGVRAASPNGVLGDATAASAVEGHRLVDGLVDDLLAHLTERRMTVRPPS